MERKAQIKIVNSWLKDISNALNINLVLNSEGVCTFQIKEDIIAIEVAPDFPMVYIYSPLLPLPAEDKELVVALLGRALELNAFQILTRGGAIGMAPGGGLLIYCYSTPIEGTNSENFSRVLGAFYETLPELKKMLTEPDVVDFKKGDDASKWKTFGSKV